MRPTNRVGAVGNRVRVLGRRRSSPIWLVHLFAFCCCFFKRKNIFEPVLQPGFTRLGTGPPEREKEGGGPREPDLGERLTPGPREPGTSPPTPASGPRSPVGVGVHHLRAHLLDAGPAASSVAAPRGPPTSFLGQFPLQLLHPLLQPLHRLGHGWDSGRQRSQPGPSPPPPPHVDRLLGP